MTCTCKDGPPCIKCGGPTLTNEMGATFCTDGCGYPDLTGQPEDGANHG